MDEHILELHQFPQWDYCCTKSIDSVTQKQHLSEFKFLSYDDLSASAFALLATKTSLNKKVFLQSTAKALLTSAVRGGGPIPAGGLVLGYPSGRTCDRTWAPPEETWDQRMEYPLEGTWDMRLGTPPQKRPDTRDWGPPTCVNRQTSVKT